MEDDLGGLRLGRFHCQNRRTKNLEQSAGGYGSQARRSSALTFGIEMNKCTRFLLVCLVASLASLALTAFGFGHWNKRSIRTQAPVLLHMAHISDVISHVEIKQIFRGKGITVTGEARWSAMCDAIEHLKGTNVHNQIHILFEFPAYGPQPAIQTNAQFIIFLRKPPLASIPSLNTYLPIDHYLGILPYDTNLLAVVRTCIEMKATGAERQPLTVLRVSHAATLCDQPEAGQG